MILSYSGSGIDSFSKPCQKNYHSKEFTFAVYQGQARALVFLAFVEEMKKLLVDLMQTQEKPLIKHLSDYDLRTGEHKLYTFIC